MNDILSRLVQISSAINTQQFGNKNSMDKTMYLIVEGVQDTIQGSVAMIYTYDISTQTFDESGRYTTSDGIIPGSGVPRPNGLGVKAINNRQNIFSVDYQDIEIHPDLVAQGFQATACFPLMDANEILGVFYVFLQEKRNFNELELSLIENFSNLTSMALAATKRFTLTELEKKYKENELRMLRKAGMLISSRTSLSGTLDAILKMALEVTGAKYGIFRLVDKSGKYLFTAAFTGENLKQPLTESIPIDEHSITGLVALKGEPLMIPDLNVEPWKSIYYPFDRELVMQSELLVPLIGASGRLEGVVNLESPVINRFTKQDRYILQILATQAVASIQEIRLLDMLQEITTLLLTQSLNKTLQSLVEKACDLLNAPNSLLWLRENDQLIVRVATDKRLIGHQINLRDSFTGQASLTASTTVSEDACGDIPFGSFGLPDYSQVLNVPLFAPDDSQTIDTFGVLSVYRSMDDTRDFNLAEWDKKVMSILGHYVLMAFQNAARQEEVRIAQEQRTVTEAFAAIGDIASNLLHQLNNKMGTIPVRIEGIQDKCQKEISENEYLNTNLLEIANSATETINVVRESLFHLRPIQFSAVDISIAIQEALNMVKIPSSITLVLESLDELPMVHACPKRLPLVFGNLLENAIQVLQDQGEIQITGIIQEKNLEIHIRDNGPGILPELHERIFELNYSNRSSGSQSGLGFGLWWVKTLMVRFGGAVSVESDGSSGTVFTLTLPLENVASEF